MMDLSVGVVRWWAAEFAGQRHLIGISPAASGYRDLEIC